MQFGTQRKSDQYDAQISTNKGDCLLAEVKAHSKTKKTWQTFTRTVCEVSLIIFRLQTFEWLGEECNRRMSLSKIAPKNYLFLRQIF